jgi:uncharacterized protein YidB (DUF937 family)
MGFLDSLTWQVLGGGTKQVALYNAVISAVGMHPEGLAGIVRQFHDAGLGQLVDSWIGTGTNLPATVEQIENGLGAITLRAIARRADMTEADAASRLTTLLPRMIDTLTPEGRLPKGDPAPNRLVFLGSMTL